jgi:glutamate carboxypeptidase
MEPCVFRFRVASGKPLPRGVGVWMETIMDNTANELPFGFIETLSDWVRLESPTDDILALGRMMDLVVAEADAAGIAHERVAGGAGLADSVILRAGRESADPGILVLSHLDTVHPVGTLENGLPLRIEGDRLYGPGVYDMKGGAFLALQAFKAAARARPHLPLTFLFTPDEEIGSPSTRGLIEDLGVKSAYVLVTEPGP